MRTHDDLLIEKPGHEHYDLIYSTVILSWHWTNKSLPYPGDAEREAW